MKYSRGPSIKFVHKIFQKTNISNPPIRTQGVRNVSFSENFAYVLDVWPLVIILTKTGFEARAWQSQCQKRVPKQNSIPVSWQYHSNIFTDFHPDLNTKKVLAPLLLFLKFSLSPEESSLED